MFCLLQNEVCPVQFHCLQLIPSFCPRIFTSLAHRFFCCFPCVSSFRRAEYCGTSILAANRQHKRDQIGFQKAQVGIVAWFSPPAEVIRIYAIDFTRDRFQHRVYILIESWLRFRKCTCLLKRNYQGQSSPTFSPHWNKVSFKKIQDQVKMAMIFFFLFQMGTIANDNYSPSNLNTAPFCRDLNLKGTSHSP